MLYRLFELQRSWLEPLGDLAGASSRSLRASRNPLTRLPSLRLLRANQALFHRLAKRYPKPAFGIDAVQVGEHEVVVREQTVLQEPFCRLLHFQRSSADAAVQTQLEAAPKVLVCAPLSGHHATLLRDTVRTLLRDHDVYVTDWMDARDVPTSEGEFHLDDYVHTIQRFVRHLDAETLHVVSVCQPTVPVLAAVSLLAQAGEKTPRTLTLMGGPIDARKSPTEVNALATRHPYAWFEKNMIHAVPAPYAGEGRRVYPGFLQLTAFVAMNPKSHLKAHLRYWVDALKGDAAEEARAVHERFYDEYNAVLDMDAAYYLETVRVVFQQFALATGTWDVGGIRVDPAAITETAIFTIEGENDDISGLGQTEAAHGLCANVPSERRRHHVAPGCGHYGIFSGSKWREGIYPQVRDFIAEHGA